MKTRKHFACSATLLWALFLTVAEAQPASSTVPSTNWEFAHPTKEDKALVRQIRRQLVKTKGIDASNLMVGAKGGTVLVRGAVSDANQMRQIVIVVRGVPGVKAVVNELIVQPSQ
jgi:hyperosmotically inducible periplasmic protein